MVSVYYFRLPILVVLTTFLLAVAWEFVVETPVVAFLGGQIEESDKDHWRYILSATVFAMIALVGPVLKLRSNEMERDRIEEELKNARAGLEQRVGERTKDFEAANALLEASDSRFQNFATIASEWFWEMDADLRFTYVPESSSNNLGRPARILLGQTKQEIYADIIAASTPDEQEKWRQHFADLEARRPFDNFVQRRMTPAGENQFMFTSGKPYFDENGKFSGYRGIGSNTTKHMQTEEAMRESERRYRAILDNMLDTYWTCPAKVPDTYLIYAATFSNASGLFPPNVECLRRGL